MSPFRSAAAWVGRHALAVVAAVALVTAAAAGGVTYALASHAGTPAPAAGPAGPHRAGRAAPGTAARRADAHVLVGVVTADTGLSVSAIEAQLKAGRSMAQVAGGNAGKLEDDLLAALRTMLDQQVRAGLLTTAQETAGVARARTFLDRAMAEPGTTLLKEIGQLRHAAAEHGRLHGGAAPSPTASAPA